jgi:hypothetical protein
MGAVHWGAVMYKNKNSTETNGLDKRYMLSVVPSLVAFFAMLHPDVTVVLLTHAVGFSGLLVADLAAVKSSLFPAWYAPLRIFLTTIVVTSLLISYAAGKSVKAIEDVKKV